MEEKRETMTVAVCDLPHYLLECRLITQAAALWHITFEWTSRQQITCFNPAAPLTMFSTHNAALQAALQVLQTDCPVVCQALLVLSLAGKNLASFHALELLHCDTTQATGRIIPSGENPAKHPLPAHLSAFAQGISAALPVVCTVEDDTFSIQPAMQPAIQSRNGMKAPFYRPPEHPVIITGDRMYSALGAARQFSGENFPEIIRRCASILSDYHHHTTTGGHYYVIGSVLTCTVLYPPGPDTCWYAEITTRPIDRLYKVIIRLMDDAGESCGFIRLDYHVTDETAMREKFSMLYRPDSADDLPVTDLPGTIDLQTTTDGFVVTRHPFTAAHCAGHFPDYPFVPAAYIQQCVLRDAFSYFGITDNTVFPENQEAYAFRAVRPDRQLQLVNQVSPTGKNRYKLLTRIYDDIHHLQPNVLIVTDLNFKR